MYAQLIEGGTTPGRREAMDRTSPTTRRPISVWEVNARA
jgi:hypothetical protein